MVKLSIFLIMDNEDVNVILTHIMDNKDDNNVIYTLIINP